MMKELYTSSQKPSESQDSNNKSGDSEVFDTKLLFKENYVGKLTKAERQQKVEKFLEKKQHRKWKSIRYTVRKDLANSRKREQGRFVKANTNQLSQSALSGKTKETVITKKLQNNSDVTFNSLSLSTSSLGKRSGKPDLYADAAI